MRAEGGGGIARRAHAAAAGADGEEVKVVLPGAVAARAVAGAARLHLERTPTRGCRQCLTNDDLHSSA